MKLLFLLAVLTLSAQAANWSRVQTAAASPNTGNPPSTTCTLSATGSGNVIMVAVQTSNSGAVTVTDNAGGGSSIYHEDATASAGAGGIGLSVQRAYNVAAGITTVTITGTGFSTAMGRCMEYHDADGAITSDNKDQAPAGVYQSETASSNWASSSVTTTASGELLIGVNAEDSSTAETSPTYTPGTGWTGVGVVNNTYDQLYVEEQLNKAIGTYTADGTYSSSTATHKYMTAIVTLKGVAASGPPRKRRIVQ